MAGGSAAIVYTREQFARALAALDTSRAQFAAALADLDTYIAHLPGTPAGPPVVPVQPGDNLADLIAQAAPGTVFALAPEYVYQGDLELTQPVTLAHAAIATVPGRGRGAYAALEPLPRILGHHIIRAPMVAFRGVHLEGVSPDRNALEVYGDDCTIDRSVVRGSAAGSRRGVYLEASRFYCRDSRLENHWQAGREAQAICAVKRAHHVVIEGCYLEGAGENILIGGDAIGAESDMCSDWAILDCHLVKPWAWRSNGATVKNLLELKAAVRVTVRDCLLEHHWVDAQSGLAIVLTVRNQYGGDPFATIADVLIEDCILRDVPAGISILGRDDSQPSIPMARVMFRNLRIEGLSSSAYGGNGRTVQIMGGPRDLVFDGLTVTAGPEPACAAFAMFADPALLCEGLVMRNMDVLEGEYGIQSSEYGLGVPTLEGYAPGYVWEGNTVTQGGHRTIPYPPGTEIRPPAPA